MNPGTAQDPGVEMAIRLRIVCEAHDVTCHLHLDRVTWYAGEIGRMLGLSEIRLMELYYATPLHDLGKIGVPLEVLNKPGKLTSQEMDVIKLHTLIGHRLLEGSAWPVIQCAAAVALSHHECWDGSGYPHGLSGEAIPIAARIVAVADVYDALISQRVYKPAWVEDRVIAEMQRMRGTKFDPDILDLFFQCRPAIPLPAELIPPSATG